MSEEPTEAQSIAQITIVDAMRWATLIVREAEDKAGNVQRQAHAQREVANKLRAALKLIQGQAEAATGDSAAHTRQLLAESERQRRDLRNDLLASENRGDDAVTDQERKLGELRRDLEIANAMVRDVSTGRDEAIKGRDDARKGAKEWFTAHEAMSTKCNDLLVKLKVALKDRDRHIREFGEVNDGLRAEVTRCKRLLDDNRVEINRLRARDAQLPALHPIHCGKLTFEAMADHISVLATAIGNQRAYSSHTEKERDQCSNVERLLRTIAKDMRTKRIPATKPPLGGRPCRINDPARHSFVATCPNYAVDGGDYCHDHDHLEL